MNNAINNEPSSQQNQNSVVACKDLTMSFQEGDLHVDVLKGINLDLKAGQTAAIIGTSGSGKSTLLHLLGGLDLPSSGDVFVTGQKMNALSETKRGLLRNQSLGFVYQFHHLLPEFTAEENVAMPLLIAGMDVSEAKEKARNILGETGMEHRIHHKPGELSGGERQRAAIARALITQPRCLLADEPTGNLDRQTADQVFNLMMEINQSQNSTLLIVTHDHELANRMDLVMKLEDGLLTQQLL